MPASEQKVSKNRYQVIPRVLIFIMDGCRVLLLRGNSNKNIWAGKYNGVGGHLEPGEDVLTAAHRELFEETGLNGLPLVMCGAITVNTTPDTGILLLVFAGQYSSGEIIPSAEGELEWVAFKDVAHLPVVEDLPAILEQVQDWRLTGNLFYGISQYDKEGKLVITFRH